MYAHRILLPAALGEVRHTALKLPALRCSESSVKYEHELAAALFMFMCCVTRWTTGDQPAWMNRVGIMHRAPGGGGSDPDREWLRQIVRDVHGEFRNHLINWGGCQLSRIEEASTGPGEDEREFRQGQCQDLFAAFV
jgi:hypothetical protein